MTPSAPRIIISVIITEISISTFLKKVEEYRQYEEYLSIGGVSAYRNVGCSE